MAQLTDKPTQRQAEMARILAHIPAGWNVVFEGARRIFCAISPDWKKDGVVVEGHCVEDVIFRVQALLLNWQPGDIVEDPTVEVEKLGLTKPKRKARSEITASKPLEGAIRAPSVRATPEETRQKLLEIARLQGFAGEFCRDCGRATLVRAGTCLKCTSCGWGGECG